MRNTIDESSLIEIDEPLADASVDAAVCERESECIVVRTFHRNDCRTIEHALHQFVRGSAFGYEEDDLQSIRSSCTAHCRSSVPSRCKRYLVLPVSDGLSRYQLRCSILERARRERAVQFHHQIRQSILFA